VALTVTRLTSPTAADLDGLAAFGQALAAAHPNWSCDPDAGVAPDRDMLDRLAAAMTLVVARDGPDIAGFAAVRDDGTIKWLVVDPGRLAAALGILQAVRTRSGEAKGKVRAGAVRDALVAQGCTAAGERLTFR